MNVEDEFALQLYAAFNYNVPSSQIVSPDTHRLSTIYESSTATGSILSIKSLERPSTPQQFIKSPALDQAYPLVTAEYFPVLKNDKAVQSSPIQLYDPSWHSLDSIGASGEESHLDHSTSVESGSTETIQSEKSIASPTSLDGDAWSEFAALSHAKTCTSRRTMLSEPHTSSSRPLSASSSKASLPYPLNSVPSATSSIASTVSSIPSVTSSMVAHAGHGDSGSTNAASIVNTDALTSRPRVTSPEYFATPLLSPTISSASSLSLSSEFRDYSVTGFSPGSSNSSRTLPPLPTYVEIGVGPDRPLSPDSLGDAVRTPTVSILPDLDDYTPGSSVLAVDEHSEQRSPPARPPLIACLTKGSSLVGTLGHESQGSFVSGLGLIRRSSSLGSLSQGMSSPGLLIPHLPEEKRTLKRALTQPTTPNIPMLHRVPLRRTQSLSARPQDVPNFSNEPESTGQEIRFQRPPLQNRTDTEISGLSLLVSFPRPPAPEVPVFATFDESQRPAESSPQIALQPASSVSLNQTDEPSLAGAAEEDNILAPQSIEGVSLSRSGAIHSRAPSPRLRHANDTAVRSDTDCGPLSMDGEHSFSVVATEENCPEPYLTGLSGEGPLSHTFGRPSPDSNFQPDEWSLVDGLEGEELSGSDGSRASGSGPGMAGRLKAKIKEKLQT